jgi:hypothetical protein
MLRKILPFDIAFIGKVVKENDIHSVEQCFNKGICDRSTGQCKCFLGFEGHACPNQCNSNGNCLTQQELADEALRKYDTPWD